MKLSVHVVTFSCQYKFKTWQSVIDPIYSESKEQTKDENYTRL